MDLRGQTREHHGCEFELQELANRLTPQRLVLIVDLATDRAIAMEAFGSAMENIRMSALVFRRKVDYFPVKN
jgi:hypothetical protein